MSKRKLHFSVFSTLAVAVKCTNASSQVKLDCPTHNTTIKMDEGTCQFRAHGDQYFSNILLGNEHTFMTLFPSRSDVAQSMGWGIFPPNIPGVISTVSWVKALDKIRNYPPVNSDYPALVPDTTFEAFKCFFYFTVQQIEASTTNGIYTEHVVDEYSQVDSFGAYKNGTISSDASIDLVFNPPFAKDSPNNTFTIPQYNYEVIGSEFAQLLNGNISVDSSSGFTGSSDLLLLLWMTHNVTRSMENLAVYMTNALRNNDSAILAEAQKNPSAIAPDQAVLVTVWVQEQFVSVRWAWLAMPLSLILFVTMFLVATIVKTSRSRIGVWKSSPLALLFHGNFDGGKEHERIGARVSVNTADAMQQASAGMNARLLGSGDNGEITIFRSHLGEEYPAKRQRH
jgi:hypothetical protein